MTLTQYGNSLVTAVRSRRITPTKANQLWARARKLALQRKIQPAPAPAMSIKDRLRMLPVDDVPPSLAQLKSLAQDVAAKAGVAAAGLGALGVGTGTVSGAAAAIAPFAIPLASLGVIAYSIFGGESYAEQLARANRQAEIAPELDEAGRRGALTNVGEKRGAGGYVP